MQADSGCGYFKEKSTGFPQIPQTVCVAYIFFLLMRNCCWCEPFRSGLGTGIVYLRATQKAPHRSASCENNLRSFVNGGADLSGGSLSTCKRGFRPVGLFYGGPQRNFCRYGILSLYSLDRGDTRAFSGV